MFAFELQFLKWLESIRTGFFTSLFEGITILGAETLVLLFVVALWFAVDSRLAQKMFFVTICSMGLNGIVKNIAQVPRPFDKGIVPVRQETATGFGRGSRAAILRTASRSTSSRASRASTTSPTWRIPVSSTLPAKHLTTRWSQKSSGA